MRLFSKHIQVAYFLLMILLIAPTVDFIEASDNGPKINGKIAFYSDRDGNWEIYTMNPDGSDQRRLTNNNYSDEGPAWSPDGSKIVFTSNRDGNSEIYMMNIDGSGQTRLTNNNYNENGPIWSPDGTKIIFSRDLGGNWEIYTMNADGSGQTRLTNNNGPWDLGAQWSPDGTKIVFVSHRDGDSDIYVMNADGSGQTILTNNHSEEELAAWSPDGSKIVFASDRNGSWEIYVMNANGSGQTRITNNNYDDYHNCWSPDGDKITFLSDRDGNIEIYVMNADGSGQTRLTQNNASDVIYGSAWQNKPAAIFTLQASTTNTVVDTLFNLNATLSVPISGPVTLYWAINDTRYIYHMNGTMMNGKFNTVFDAKSPGTWAFKVAWAGDEIYTRTESNNITVKINEKPKLAATITLQPSNLDMLSESVTIIKIAVNSNGSKVLGATVILSSDKGGSITPVTDIGDGIYLANFTAPYATATNVLTLSASVLKADYINCTTQIQLTIRPKILLVIITAGSDTVYSGGTSTIIASVTSNGAAVSGSTLNLISSNGGMFSAVVDQGNGTYITTFTAPDVVAQTLCNVSASGSKIGYIGGSSNTLVTVKPLVLNIVTKDGDGALVASVSLASTSQPIGQTALSGSTDSNGQASFNGILRGTYNFKATKSGYDDKTWTLTVQQGKVTYETITLTKQSGGIPGNPMQSVALALIISAIIIYHKGNRKRATPQFF